MGGAIAGAGMGLIGGLLGNQKEGGTDTGNVYGGTYDALGGAGAIGQRQLSNINNQQSYKGDPAADLQNNSVLGGLFGKGGTMDRTNTEEQQLAGQGYQLTPEDHTAYGQASANIARQFGQNEQSLGQALSDRGLSNSGVAGAQFSGLQGNKNEQLAGLQTKIADDRMNNTMQRLGQTRQFLGQLGQQAQSGMGQQEQFGRDKANDANNMEMNKFNMTNGVLGNYQQGKNNNLEQQQQTQHASTLSNAFNGMSQGGMAGMSAGNKKPGMS